MVTMLIAAVVVPRRCSMALTMNHYKVRRIPSGKCNPKQGSARYRQERRGRRISLPGLNYSDSKCSEGIKS
jgi:hypothetical protein